MIERLFAIPFASESEIPGVTIPMTGPGTQKPDGDTSPPDEGGLPQGTIHLPGNGDARTLQCDLCLCLPKSMNDEPWTFPMPPGGLKDLVRYHVEDDKGNELLTKFLPAPNEAAPLTDGGRVFRAGKYGSYAAPFPESLSFVDGKPVMKDLVVVWAINELYGSGSLRVYLRVKGASWGIVPTGTWQLV